MQISSIYSQREPLKQSKRRPARELSKESIDRMAEREQLRARLVALVRANGFPDCRHNVRIKTLREVLKAKGVKY